MLILMDMSAGGGSFTIRAQPPLTDMVASLRLEASKLKTLKLKSLYVHLGEQAATPTLIYLSAPPPLVVAAAAARSETRPPKLGARLCA